MTNSYVRKKAFNKIKNTIVNAENPIPFLQLSVKVYSDFGLTQVYTKKVLGLLEDAGVIEQVMIHDELYYKKAEGDNNEYKETKKET